MTMMESMMIKRLKEVPRMELEIDNLKEIVDFSFSAYRKFLSSDFPINQEGIYNFCKQNNYSFFTFKCIKFLFIAEQEFMRKKGISRENSCDMAE